MGGVPRERVTFAGGGKLMTKQSMALESDVNTIVARHIAHGIPFPVSGRASYGDFFGVTDYHEALDRLKLAEDEFGRLPAGVRDYCENDPGVFLNLVYDGSRRDELVKLGLVPAAIPADAPVVEAGPVVLPAPVVP